MKNVVSFRNFNTNPFSMLDDFQSDLKTILNSIQAKPSFSENEKEKMNYHLPICQIGSNEEQYSLSFDLPGIPKEDIKIEFHDGRIIVSGERKIEKDSFDYTEKKYGRFERAMTIPQDVKEDEISAYVENGVLNIVLPKIEKSYPKKISISERNTDKRFKGEVNINNNGNRDKTVRKDTLVS